MSDRLLLRIFLFLFALMSAFIGTPISAQDKTERLRTATVRLGEIEKAVKALPEPPKLSRNVLPLPDLTALLLGRSLRAFMDEFGDLPLYHDAARLFARTALSSSDGAFAAATLEAAVKHGAEGDLRGDLIAEAARIRAAFGDHTRAIGLLTDALALCPKHTNAGSWQASISEWTPLAAQEDAEYAALKKALGGRPTPQAVLEARRFVQGYPLRPESATIAAMLARAAESTDLAQSLEFTERIAWFGFGSADWSAAAERAISALGREGEYERAYFYSLRLLDAKGTVAGLDVEGHTRELAEFEKRWKAVLARDIAVQPKTKLVRFNDLMRRKKLDPHADSLRADLEDFETDYPTATETAEVRLDLGRSLADKDPEQAIQKLKAAAESTPNAAIGAEAALLAAQLLEKSGDAEGAMKVLASRRQRTKDAREKLRLGAAEVHAHEKAGDKEAAQKLADDLRKSAPEDMKVDLESMLSGAGENDDPTIP